MSLKKLVKQLDRLRSSTIRINGEEITFDADIPDDLQSTLRALKKDH